MITIDTDDFSDELSEFLRGEKPISNARNLGRFRKQELKSFHKIHTYLRTRGGVFFSLKREGSQRRKNAHFEGIFFIDGKSYLGKGITSWQSVFTAILFRYTSELSCHQGHVTFSMDTKFAQKTFEAVPPAYRMVVKGSVCCPTFRKPNPMPRNAVVSAVQEEMRRNMPDVLKEGISKYSHTLDCQKDDGRYIRGVTVSCSKNSQKPDRTTGYDAYLLMVHYLANKAPIRNYPNEPHELIQFPMSKPDVTSLLNVNFRAGSLGPMSVDYPECSHKNSIMGVLPRTKTKRAANIMEATQRHWNKCMDGTESILPGNCIIKAEVSKHTVDPLTDEAKKIRAIINSNPVKYTMAVLASLSRIQAERGLLNDNFISEAIKDAFMDLMFRVWYERCIRALEEVGIKSYGDFLVFLKEQGLDCSDKETWEATTKMRSALLHQLKNFLHVPAEQQETFSRVLANVSAEYSAPFVMVGNEGGNVQGFFRPGSTESGHFETLDGNTSRHVSMIDLFVIHMDAYYNKGCETYKGMFDVFKCDGLGEPPVIEPRYIREGAEKPADVSFWLKLESSMRNLMGDDYISVATPFAEYKTRWVDAMFGTITKGGVKPFLAELDEYGLVSNDSADYLRNHFIIADDQGVPYVKTVRDGVRVLAKLLHAPHEPPAALAAARSAMYICGSKAIYDRIHEYYMKVLEGASATTTKDDLIAGLNTAHEEDGGVANIQFAVTLKPPSWNECQAFLSPNCNRLVDMMFELREHEVFRYISKAHADEASLVV